MVKKILIALGVAFLVFIGLMVALMVWAHRAGAEAQEKFYTAMESGDVERMMSLLAPTLRQQVDPPVMAAFMKYFEDRVGKYQGLRSTDFHSSSKYENGVSRVESAGTVDFEKGSAQSELMYVDGKLNNFNVSSPQLPVNWFNGPATTDLYRDEGKTFLEGLIRDDPAALPFLLPDVQKRTSLADLKKKSESAIAEVGPLQSIEYQSEKSSKDDYVLTITYLLRSDRKDLTAKVDFRFRGLKGGVSGYEIVTAEKSDRSDRR